MPDKAALEEARARIDAIDREMAALFVQRMGVAADVAAYKSTHNLPVLDAAREEAVLQKNLAYFTLPDLAGYYTDYMRHLMGLSRQYQSALLGRDAVCYQGALGGFGHMAATALFPHARATDAPTFAAVFAAVEKGDAACGVVPFENSSTGDVSDVLDLCYAYPGLYVSAMYDLPVTQNLLGLPGATLADIKAVCSHPQALQQSRRFLSQLDAVQEPCENTAVAARAVAEGGDKTRAAIASLEAGSLYGLVPLAWDISTESDNTTRFIVLTKEKPTAGNRFSLLVTVENGVGRLAQVIQAISEHNFDMECIKSRPMPHRPWEYYFYIELVGNATGDTSRALLDKLDESCLSVRMLGIYQRGATG